MLFRVRKPVINNKLQGTVVTYLRCGGIANNNNQIANMPIGLTKLRKVYCWVYKWIFFTSVNIWQSYKQEAGCLVHFVCLATILLHEAQLSPRDRAMGRVSWNLASCHATVQKLLVRQVLNKSKLWSWRVTLGRRVGLINMCTQPWRDRVASIVL